MDVHTSLFADENKHRRALESLTQELSAATETIEEAYRIERASLERVARITTYIPVLAMRSVKLKLAQSANDDANPSAWSTQSR